MDETNSSSLAPEENEDGLWHFTTVIPVMAPPFPPPAAAAVPAYPFLVQSIYEAAQEVHQQLGGGHLEAVYQKALEYEMNLRRIDFQSQVWVPVMYKDHQVGVVRLDLMVRDEKTGEELVVELKSVDRGWRPFLGQLSKYQRLFPKSHVLALNFGLKIVDIRYQ